MQVPHAHNPGQLVFRGPSSRQESLSMPLVKSYKSVVFVPSAVCTHYTAIQ